MALGLRGPVLGRDLTRADLAVVYPYTLTDPPARVRMAREAAFFQAPRHHAAEFLRAVSRGLH